MGTKIETGVGSSKTRTPGKHAFLNKRIGMESAVSSRLGRRYVMLDLCAGDGAPDVHSNASSPEIMMRHREFALKAGWTVPTVVLNEKSPLIHKRLDERFHSSGAMVLRGDARTPGHIPTVWGPDDCVLVHNDPNLVADYALTSELVARLPDMTTVISTLGCNVAGLKRLGIEARRQWFPLVAQQTKLLQRRHDMGLFSLNGDDAQWAYAVNAPIKWREQIEKDFCASFSGWRQVDFVWLRKDPAALNALARKHFLTRKENAEGLR